MAGAAAARSSVSSRWGTPRGGELPAVPEHGERAERLQMADLEAAAKEMDVGLDDGAPVLRLGRAEEIQVIAGAVGDQKGHARQR